MPCPELLNSMQNDNKTWHILKSIHLKKTSIIVFKMTISFTDLIKN